MCVASVLRFVSLRRVVPLHPPTPVSHDPPLLPPPQLPSRQVPLGWDGKPIPFWLYKLHGLDQTFSCEICRGETYRGRRDFERHFSGWQHSAGMKALGIPNTKHFHGVTKLDEATKLWARLKTQLAEEKFVPDRDMEFEDSEGNVFDKKTYENLAKQGLL